MFFSLFFGVILFGRSPGDITGIANVPCFATIGSGNGKDGIDGVVDNRGSGAIAGKRHQPGAKHKQDAE